MKETVPLKVGEKEESLDCMELSSDKSEAHAVRSSTLSVSVQKKRKIL